MTEKTLTGFKALIDHIDKKIPIPNFIYTIIGYIGWWFDPV